MRGVGGQSNAERVKFLSTRLLEQWFAKVETPAAWSSIRTDSNKARHTSDTNRQSRASAQSRITFPASPVRMASKPFS
jgi:primosomal protein N''